MEITRRNEVVKNGDDNLPEHPESGLTAYGIDINDHGNAIEVYGMPWLRDYIVNHLKTLSPNTMRHLSTVIPEKKDGE